MRLHRSTPCQVGVKTHVRQNAIAASESTDFKLDSSFLQQANSSSDGGTCRMDSATGLAMATAGARTLTALLADKTPPEFRFVYLFRNICLGRRDGVVQFVDRRDVPRSIVWTGAIAAAWKEYICQSTLSTIGLSAPEKLPILPPVRMLTQLLQGMQQYA